MLQVLSPRNRKDEFRLAVQVPAKVVKGWPPLTGRHSAASYQITEYLAGPHKSLAAK